MAKKQKNKNSEAEKLEAGDVITTDQGEKFELDGEQAASLNEQMTSEDEVEDSKEESAPPAPQKTENVKKEPVKGTFLFNKLKNR